MDGNYSYLGVTVGKPAQEDQGSSNFNLLNFFLNRLYNLPFSINYFILSWIVVPSGCHREEWTEQSIFCASFRTGGVKGGTGRG